MVELEVNVRQLSRQKEQSGQSLVEFALVLMFVILPFMFVLVDGAFTLYTYVMLTNAVREGARGGSIYQTSTAQTPFQDVVAYRNQIDAERATFVLTETQRLAGTLVSFPPCSPPNITYLDTSDPMYSDNNPFREMNSLTLQVDCPRRLFFGLIGTSQITLTARSTMRIEPGGVAP